MKSMPPPVTTPPSTKELTTTKDTALTPAEEAPPPTIPVTIQTEVSLSSKCPNCGATTLSITGHLNHDRYYCNNCGQHGTLDELLGTGSENLKKQIADLQEKLKVAEENEKKQEAAQKAADAAAKQAADKHASDEAAKTAAAKKPS